MTTMQILGTSRGEREGQCMIFLVVVVLVAVGVLIGIALAGVL